MSDDDVKSAISPAWYLAALALALTGWVVGVAVAGGAWDTVRSTTVTSSNEPISANGSSVAAFTDVLQTGRTIVCLSSEPGRRPRQVPPAPLPLAIDDDGTTWHLIAFEPKGRAAMTLSCGPKDRQADKAQNAFAKVDGFLQRARIGNVIIVAAMFGSVATAVAILIRRRRELREQS
jgi:hypothetical protein